ncbi:hypothetical protein E4U21_007528 [Claviceps maximensis]|nr:hypothetical protein E4U21_007528 [Claviceps maximensis]
MMATEPSGDDLAARSVSSQLPPLDPADDLHRHDVSIKNGLAVTPSNEVADKPSSSLEEQSNSAEISLSGGSDTEASRTEWSKQIDVDKGHGRSASSAKKPTTFKAVSVNKTFLASKANPSGVVPKALEKPVSGSSTPPPGSSSLSSTRPRLIAKTVGGARDSAPKYSSLSNGAKSVSGPDPSAVWNKNRPPEPKKLTDEELKKYGIHMASRLNEEDAQGQNKWADIDEDDEDWAPEAITWGDGTKTTLPHPDEPQAPTQDTITLPSLGIPRPKLTTTAPLPVPAPVPAPVSIPVPVSAPVSVPANKPMVSKSSGLASGRGLVLKPASQEKPSLIAKPSAPVTSVKSPWATLPPVDRASPGLLDNAVAIQAHPKEGMQTKSLQHQPKEITADDFTRSSWREGPSYANRELYNSQSGRYEPVPDRRGSFKSDVLAKQPALLQRPQPTDQTGEACVSQQPARVAQDGLHTRRRGSSSVSTGSVSFHQRALRNIDSTVPPSIIPSHQISNENPVSPGDTSSSRPALPKDYVGHPQADNTSTGPASAAPVQSAGNSASERPFPSVAESKDVLINEVEYQKQLMRERRELARKRRLEEEAKEEAAKKERIQKKLEALGPPPEKRSDKKESLTTAETPKPTHIQQRERPSLSDSNNHAVDKSSSGGHTNAHSIIPNQTTTPQVSSHPQPPNHSIPPTSTSFRRLSQGQDSRRNDPWGGPGPRPDRFPSWGAAAPPSSRNVWGSPDNDRGLGNGTFNPDLGRVTNTSTSSSPHAKGSLPIAPTRNGAVTLSHPHPQAQAQASQGPAVDSQSSRFVPLGSELASKWVAAVAENDQKISTAALSERASRERQLMERGLTLEDSQPVIRDSWRPIRVPGDGTRHPIGSVDVQAHTVAPWKSAHDSLVKSVAMNEASGLPTKPGVIGSGAPSQSRPSRFFPARDHRQETCVGPYASRSISPTPPPPTMEDHPVYEGDVLRPHVSLPKPQPVVKLPPAMSATERNSVRSHGPWSAQVATKDNERGDHARSSHPGGGNIWQARFHKLLHGDKPSSTRDIGVDASSRGLLESTYAQTSAIVLLPNSTSIQTDEGFQSFVTKPMAEECFEEQEMGSLPQIRLPHKTPEAAWQPAVVQSRGLPKRFSVHVATREVFQFTSDSPAGPPSVNILFPGMKVTKKVLLSNPTTRGSRASHGQRTATRHRGFGTGSRGGKKEKPSSQEGDVTTNRGGRAGFRNKTSDSWTRRQPQQS